MKGKFVFVLLAALMLLSACTKISDKEQAEPKENTTAETPVVTNPEEPSKEAPLPEQEEEKIPLSMTDLWNDGSEAEKAYAEFVDQGWYEPTLYQVSERTAPMEQYALVDIDEDGSPELLLASMEMEYGNMYRNYMAFQYQPDTKTVENLWLCNEEFYDRKVQYSRSEHAIVFEDEYLWYHEEDLEPIWDFRSPEKSFQIGPMDFFHDEDSSVPLCYYEIGQEPRKITREEYEEYTADLSEIEFSPILTDPAIELSQYLGQDLSVLQELTGPLQETEDPDGYLRLENGEVTVLLKQGSDTVWAIGLHRLNDEGVYELSQQEDYRSFIRNNYTIEGIRPTACIFDLTGIYMILDGRDWTSQNSKSQTSYLFSDPAGRQLELRLKEKGGGFSPDFESIWIYGSSLSD